MRKRKKRARWFFFHKHTINDDGEGNTLSQRKKKSFLLDFTPIRLPVNSDEVNPLSVVCRLKVLEKSSQCDDKKALGLRREGRRREREIERVGKERERGGETERE